MRQNRKIIAITTRLRATLWRTSGLLVLLALWEIAPRWGWAEPQFLPPFSTAAETIYRQWLAGYLWAHLAVSLWRVVTGLFMAMLIGIPLGFLLGSHGRVTVAAFNPLFRLLSQANPFSLLPVFMLFFGIGEAAKLAVIAWVCLWPVLFNTISGVQNIDTELIKIARAFGLKTWERGTQLFLPATAPAIFTGLRIGVEMAFFILIAAEMIGAIAGLGWLLHTAAHLNQIPRMYAAATCIVILGVILNRSLAAVEKRLFFWREDETSVIAGAIVGAGSGGQPEGKPRRPLSRWQIALISILLLGIIVFGGLFTAGINQKGGLERPTRHGPMQTEDSHFGSSGGI